MKINLPEKDFLDFNISFRKLDRNVYYERFDIGENVLLFEINHCIRECPMYKIHIFRCCTELLLYFSLYEFHSILLLKYLYIQFTP